MPDYTVLGATGFVGRRLVSTLTTAGFNCLAPGRDSDEIFKCNLGRVFYCIGMTADYAQYPFNTIEAHVCFLARILKEAQFEHLVYLSSTRLYDNLAVDVAQEDMPLCLTPKEPRHIYDLSKALGENVCLNVVKGRASVARLACVFDTEENAPGFLSEWLQRATREKKFTLPSSTGVVRDYIHVDDVVNALKAIVDNREAAIFNVASGENISNHELAGIFNDCGWQVTLRDRTELQSAPLCDNSRLRALGCLPRSVRDVVRGFLYALEGQDASR